MSFQPREKLFATMSAFAATIDWPQIISRIPNAAREISARLPVTDRCAENWLEGRSKPNGDNVIMLFAQFDEVADEIIRLTSRQNGSLSHEQRRKLKEVIEQL